MKWLKKGLLYRAGNIGWAANSALQPTPLILDERTVRLYCGFRDENGVSQVGFVDIEKAGDELKVKAVSDKPVLGVGMIGTFDDNGVVPSAVVKRDGAVYMYYAGYQLLKNVRFMVLGGLAISKDGGNTFERYQHTPLLERTDKEFLFRVIHTIFEDNGTWRTWYGGGNHFQKEGDRTLPVYDIRYMESPDGLNFPCEGSTVLQNAESEHRVGRPFVFKSDGKYFMFFGASTPEVPYRLAYAVSEDGFHWTRKDDLGLSYAKDDFDSSMSAYPSVVTLEGTTFLIYNGNDYGKDGFGYAVLEGKLG